MSNPIRIGKIVKSNTHVDYVCQIDAPGESDGPLPEPTDYSFGTFAAIQLESGSQLIGVIYNTLLVNPDFGNMGPRLSPSAELEVFAPDYLAETATLVGIIAVGWIDRDGAHHQGVPVLAGTVNCAVYRLDDDALRQFHCTPDGRPRLTYMPLLLAQNNPLVPTLLMNILDTLGDLFPAQRDSLGVMRNNLAWKSIVQPTG